LNDELVKLAYEWQTSFQNSNKSSKSNKNSNKNDKSKNGKREEEGDGDGDGEVHDYHDYHDYHDHPTEPVGDPVVVSTALITKWGRYFSACDDDDDGAM
jgi:hypothetical protein